MHARSWISLLVLGSSVASAGCGDDTVASSSDDSTSSSDGSTSDAPTATGLDSSTSGDVESTGMDTTGPMPGCGDGMLEPGMEECDDGNDEDDDGCSASCTIEEGYTCEGQPSECLVICGDALIVGAETCDDDNVLDGDGCSAECQIEEGYACEGLPSVCASVCGDGVIVMGMEDCDDGNPDAGDGCSASCLIEQGFFCGQVPSVCESICGDGLIVGDEGCDDANLTADDGCSPTCEIELGWSCAKEPSVCMTGCGDGITAGMEQCDDADLDDGDGCSAACELEPGWVCMGMPTMCETDCGDGIVAGLEECDDAGVLDGDGCSSTCVAELGWDCNGEPSVCSTQCGDGIIAGLEMCDDMGVANGDGCSGACTIETGYSCAGMPSLCTVICGDGLIVGGEECDDAGAMAGDGCSDTCMVEQGWTCVMEPSVCSNGCGDGVIGGFEECDDGDFVDGDGCTATCLLESGWICAGEPSVCSTECGDGLIAGLEECDDGGIVPDDGCSDSCLVEFGYTCQGEPSVCAIRCGDGVIAGSEACDDGNISPGDGCSLTCQDEFAWECLGVPSVCTLTGVLDRMRLGIDGGCVLTTAGELGCFGINSQGEVGIGIEDVEIHIPAFALDQVIAFASGEEHNCAVRMDGSGWCWGDNSQTQLGPNAMGTTDEFSPIEVPGMPPLADIRAGDDHNCALDIMGGVWCWGDNTNRQLGRGGADVTDDPTPQPVALPGGLPAIDLGPGDDHSCVVLSDNTVACWGDDDQGQLGDGAAGADSGDALVVLGLPVVVDVESGDDHTCALTDMGEVYCWGDNIDGQLGDGTGLDRAFPDLLPLPADAEDITLGDDFTCALLVTDEIYCVGEGADFQLANGDLVDVLSPTLVLGLPPVDLVDIDAGGRGVCAVSSTGARYCWGYSETGLLGIAPLNQVEPMPPIFSGPIDQLVLSPPEYRGVICGVLGDDSIECSGDGTLVSSSTISGAAGLFEPITAHVDTPTSLPLVSDVQDMEIGDGFACIATTVDVQCWGDNSQRQLGQGGVGTADILTPTPVMNLGAVDELEVGDQFACIRLGGQVECWGDNGSFQTGEGTTTTDQSTPVPVMGLVDAIDIDLGEDHACALRAGGQVECWGEDGIGQLGDNDGNTVDSATPVAVTGLPGGVVQIAVGQDHACALAGGDVYCWGEGGFGNLGQGNELDSDTALLVPGVGGIVQIAAGFNFTCAIDGAGDMSCWGYALDGHLGDGGQEVSGTNEIRSPIPFPLASNITNVVGGNGNLCIESGGTWGCLGFRSAGQMGNGSTSEPAIPTLMTFGL